MEIPYTVTARKDTGLYNSKVGIWLFLASEVMLFGGLFSGYVFLRIYADYPWPERSLPVLPGLINTFVLIGSSVTVVFAWAALKMRQWRRFQIFMGITIACAGIFMVLKGIEYKAKWGHQAIRMDDFTIIEGHTHKAQLDKAGDFHLYHPDHGKDHLGGENEGGTPFPANRVIFRTAEVNFSVDRFHEPWVNAFLAQAKERKSRLVAARRPGTVGIFLYGHPADFVEDSDPNDDKDETEEAEKAIVAKYAGEKVPIPRRFGKKSLYIPEGTPLDVELLEEARKIFIAGRAINQKERTRNLRAQWRKAKDEHKGKANWEIMRDDPVQIDEDALAELTVPVASTLGFRSEQGRFDVLLRGGWLWKWVASPFVDESYAMVLHRGWIKRRVPGGAAAAELRDDTGLKGQLAHSPLALAVDAIDFRFVAMKAEQANKVPMDVIEDLWIFSDENPNAAEFKSVWTKHKAKIKKLEDELGKKNKVPTDTERYRVGWKDLVEYHYDGDRPSMTQGFAGPSHKNEKFKKAFLELEVPHEQIALESKFTPKWNTYYGIYFTLTGLHGLHVIGGAIVLGYYLFFSKGLYRRNPEWLANRVEVGGLFWHFVDLVWIFLFPILYLM